MKAGVMKKQSSHTRKDLNSIDQVIIHSETNAKELKKMKFEIRPSVDRQFYYVLVGSNGEDMMTSETIATKRNCKKSIASIKRSVNLFTKVVDCTKDFLIKQ